MRSAPSGGRTDSALRPALEHLVKGIVEHSDDVRVRLVDARRGARLEVRVHPDDLGTVIGRGGRTARALRQVIGSIGGKGLRVDIVDAY
ncbi:RNA-binding protein [Hamadaea tsunoensis]|uniref:RNA-binding protein n=1 Tax=Hamadaea tsunoensis TaxID=53368 RepID=UPI0004896C55|nr:RNA-binding protein [Hamadaea tsunoensis]